MVVFFYGGSWNSGSRDDYGFVGEALASRGIVVVIADYRLYPQVRYPAFLQDNAHAVAWTYQHIAEHGGDPHQLYVMGHSSGAYNASMLALDPRWLKAVNLSPTMLKGWIGLAGPYDFLLKLATRITALNVVALQGNPEHFDELGTRVNASLLAGSNGRFDKTIDAAAGGRAEHGFQFGSQLQIALALLGRRKRVQVAELGQVTGIISLAALSFMVHEPSGIMVRSSARSLSASLRR